MTSTHQSVLTARGSGARGEREGHEKARGDGRVDSVSIRENAIALLHQIDKRGLT